MNRRGVSLIAVAVAMIILGVGVWVFMQSGAMLSIAGGRIDQGLKGQQVLVGVAGALQRLDFSQIIAECGGAANLGNDITGNCVNGAALQDYSAQTEPTPGRPPLNIRLNENGKIVSNGDNCVELKKCVLKGNGNILEITLMAHWNPRAPDTKMFSKAMTLRRVRW